MCSWNLPGPDNYALQYADGVQTYITESVSHHDLCTNQCKYLSTPGDHVVKGRAHLEDIEQWTRVRCFYLRRQCCKPPFKMWITVLSALCDLCLFAEYLESRSKSLKMEPRSHNIINAIFFFLSARQTKKMRREHEKEKSSCNYTQLLGVKLTFWEGCHWRPSPLFRLQTGLQKPLECHQADAENDALLVVINKYSEAIAVLLFRVWTTRRAFSTLTVGRRQFVVKRRCFSLKAASWWVLGTFGLIACAVIMWLFQQ